MHLFLLREVIMFLLRDPSALVFHGVLLGDFIGILQGAGGAIGSFRGVR